jgi:phage-related protein
MTAVPQSHIDDAHSPVAAGIVELFHVILNDGSNLYLKPNNTVTWCGNTYEGIGIQISGVMSGSDATNISRPSLVVANALGAFSSFVVQGKLNRAQVMRYRVLDTDIATNNFIFVRQSWKVWRVMSMNKTSITMELRSQLDLPALTVPARQFLPPDFPSVTL